MSQRSLRMTPNIFCRKNVTRTGKSCKNRNLICSKCSGALPAFDDSQKDSESTGANGTQVKPVLLAVEIFAV